MLVKIEERFLLIDMIDIMSDSLSLDLLRDLYGQLAIQDYEVDEKKIVDRGGYYDWGNDTGKEIRFPKSLKKRIANVLKNLSDKGELLIECDRLYELFCGGR